MFVHAPFGTSLTCDFADIQPPVEGAEGAEASHVPEVQSISSIRSCSGDASVAGCKVFHVSEEYGPNGPCVLQKGSGASAPQDLDQSLLKGEVLIFQYKGQFHAVDHKCPHSSYPLSDATLFDIEDFGIVLSAGLTCPKHGWSFDIFTGLGDRGNYRLKIWEVELRQQKGVGPSTAGEDGEAREARDALVSSPPQEVWVRRKPRIG